MSDEFLLACNQMSLFGVKKVKWQFAELIDQTGRPIRQIRILAEMNEDPSFELTLYGENEFPVVEHVEDWRK